MYICLAGMVITSGASITMMLIHTGIMRTMTLHHEHDEIEKIEHQWSRPRSDWAVIAGLVALLTFSPCEAFLPVFLTGAKYGWFGFALLSAILAIATVAGMIVFTWLTLLGLQRLRFKALEKYEPITVGVVFCLLGLIIILFEH